MLRDAQRLFKNELLNKTHPTLLTEPALSIYQNNVRSVLNNALKEIYPCIYQVVGADFFQALAHHYAQVYPSQQGDLNQYGAHLAAFIADYPPANRLVYLAEIAQLEWAYHQVFYSAPQPSLEINSLAAIPPTRYEQLVFSINPAYCLLRCHYPVLRIWRLCQEEMARDDTINLNEGGNNILVRREGLDVVLDLLSEGEFALLAALKNQEPLLSACDKALSVETGLAIDNCLARFFSQGVFTAFDYL